MKAKTKLTRLWGFLLALVMIVGMLPTTVFASGEITTAKAKVTAPVGGETPSFTATSEDPSKYSVSVSHWIDLERNMDIHAYELADPDNYYYNYTFEAGKEYAVVISFNEIEGGPQLSRSTQFFINGNQSTRAVAHFSIRRYDFTATGSGGGTVTPTYTATVDSIDFGSVKLGYRQPDYKNLTINNTGNSPLSVNVDSVKFITGSEYFQLATFNSLVSNIPVGGQCTSWSVCPKANLNIGTYTATVQFQDSKGEMSAPATATVTFKVEDHDYDTTKWKYDADSHWNPCKDSGCNAKGNIAEHDRNKEVGGYDADFNADGKTPDLYCSVCNRKMQSGEAIAAGKYIRESKATMTPAGIDNTISANDLVFTSLDTSKYTVRLYRVFDMTDTTLNTVGMGYPHDKKFISGHKYAIEFEFEAVAPYVYDAMHGTHTSTFKLNDADTMMSAATALTGSPSRRVELVAGGVSVATYDLKTSVNGGHGTISAGENGITEGTSKIITFTPDSGYEIDKVMVNGTETTVTGNTLTVTMDGNKNVVVTYKAIEYTITVTDGKATVGAGSEISKAAEGTAVTLTANAAPSGKVFDKWEVVSGGITLADANSATTTFTMPASAVSLKATYKNAPHTHTYNQETVKPEALKTPADCTGNAVYFKSCSCGAISTTDAFVAMNTALGHAYGSDWKYDSTNHWHECSRCHDKKYEAAHDYGSDNVCDTCGYYKTVTHTHNLTLVAAKAATCTTAGNSAYYTCDGCDKWFADATGSVEITDKTSVKIPAPGHTAGTEWKSDDTNHWHECTVAGCGVIIESTKSAHDYGSDNVCDTCGYNKTVPHTHNLTLVAAKAATCTEGGKKAYYKCEGCGKFYEDVLGTKEITDLASWGNIAKIAHTTKQTVTKATPTANGKIVNYCSVCKKTLSTTVIPNASSIKLKATSLTYNGKVRTPKVIVKDRTGKTLVKNTDYTVSYAKGRKYVGKYAVKITFKGKYSGTKTLYFTIKPKATSISSLKAGSKKFTVKWKKQATQTTGYQVQYSASSKFSKAKTVTVGKNTTVSKKISKLSGKKKYYVRVRTYKTVKINGKSIRIYSGWSKAKTVTTKK